MEKKSFLSIYAKSFNWAGFFLPKNTYEECAKLYAFCRVLDDIVDTAGTLCAASKALKERGALKVVAYCTHAVLSGRALDNIENSELDELVVTDTVPLSDKAKKSLKIRCVSVAGLIGESINRIYLGQSLSSMFVD